MARRPEGGRAAELQLGGARWKVLGRGARGGGSCTANIVIAAAVVAAALPRVDGQPLILAVLYNAAPNAELNTTPEVKG